MSETYYKIRRAGGKPATTWIGSTSCSRVFDPEQDTFIVSEAELGICIHNGNFKLEGPAPADEIPPQPTQPPPEPVVEEEPEPIAEPEESTETEPEPEEE